MKLLEKEIKIIVDNKDKSLACITSLIYFSGFKGIRYFELRKVIFKELQRLDTKLKNYTE